LVPDYATTTYLHPANRGQTIRIEMQGNRTQDFSIADAEMRKIIPGFMKPTDYTWHHLDDFVFDSTTGKSYCTMQLVESVAHGGTGVTGMAHSGSVAQWKAFFDSGY
jgi:hypothetical protein